jgi:uncharacterized membrane protein
MENLVVTTFSDAENATEGLNKLNELDQLGDITIYNLLLIRKTSESQFELLHQQGPAGTDLPATGAMAGTLIGAIGGPIGMAMGLLTGALIGSIDEDDTKAFTKNFLDKVNGRVSVGTFAIVLDVEEDTEFMINSYMDSYKGVTVHTPIAGQLDDYEEEQWDELDKEIDEEQKVLETAAGKEKEAIKEKIVRLKEEKAKRMAKFKAGADKTKKQLQQRLAELDQKISTSRAQAKDRLTRHSEKIKEKLSRLNAKMARALV